MSLKIIAGKLCCIVALVPCTSGTTLYTTSNHATVGTVVLYGGACYTVTATTNCGAIIAGPFTVVSSCSACCTCSTNATLTVSGFSGLTCSTCEANPSGTAWDGKMTKDGPSSGIGVSDDGTPSPPDGGPSGACYWTANTPAAGTSWNIGAGGYAFDQYYSGIYLNPAGTIYELYLVCSDSMGLATILWYGTKACSSGVTGTYTAGSDGNTHPCANSGVASMTVS